MSDSLTNWFNDCLTDEWESLTYVQRKDWIDRFSQGESLASQSYVEEVVKEYCSDIIEMYGLLSTNNKSFGTAILDTIDYDFLYKQVQNFYTEYEKDNEEDEKDEDYSSSSDSDTDETE